MACLSNDLTVHLNQTTCGSPLHPLCLLSRNTFSASKKSLQPTISMYRRLSAEPRRSIVSHCLSTLQQQPTTDSQSNPTQTPLRVHNITQISPRNTRSFFPLLFPHSRSQSRLKHTQTMCTSSSQEAANLIQVKATSESSAYPFSSSSSPTTMSAGHQIHPMALAEYHQRLQLYDYAQQAALRLRLTQSALASSQSPSGSNPVFGMSPHPALADAASPFSHMSPFARFDPRYRFVHEEPKPPHSYIGLIAMAILSNADRKMVLSDIYQYILDNYPYFRNRGPGWRNSIRHNLSLNDCFVKAGRSANGKGHYWAIHPANVEDFRKGDFRRRKAQRKVRKHMGLSVPEDEDSNSPTPTPVPTPMSSPFPPNRQSSSPTEAGIAFRPPHMLTGVNAVGISEFSFSRNRPTPFPSELLETFASHSNQRSRVGKRMFDVESLLAPDSTVGEVRASAVTRRQKTMKEEDDAVLDIETRTSSPRSTNASPCEFTCRTSRTGSNCSSPSVSSSSVASPQPANASKTGNEASDSGVANRETGTGSSIYGCLSSLQVAHIQSLQNLQHMNSGMGQGIRCENGLAAWAAMSALASSQPNNFLTTYSAAFAASMGQNRSHDHTQHHLHANSVSPVVPSSRSACNQK